MQAGAQILMEPRNRRRAILCAASHRLPTLPNLPLPVVFIIFIFYFFTILAHPFFPCAAR